MSTAIDDLKDQLGTIDDLRAAASVLSWDQETFMPSGGAEARAQQIATLETMAHERFVDDTIGELLDRLEDDLADADARSEEASLARVTRRDYERARKLPTDLVRAISHTVSEAKEAWKKARNDDDFPQFALYLERLIELNVEKADALGYEGERYDALLDEYEPGMKTATVADTFDSLRADLVPIVETISEHDAPDDDFLHAAFDPHRQRQFGESVIADVGYDFSRGRQDDSAHPFTTSFSIHDVRLTTRFDANFFPSAFFATMHEAGHGLYEQGIDPALDRTPLADGTSLGMHESQSRLWENLVGRSRPFWTHYYPPLRASFPKALGDVPLDAFYRAINKVESSLIRVEADEVTYNLHIMLRFELERGLITGEIDASDLPRLWKDKMEEYLGVRPDTDANGVLQDVHWSLGAFGYFPTYALGNLMSVQLYNQARADLDDLDGQISTGTFEPLLTWLRTNIHQYGRKLDAPDLLERVTGNGLQAEPWLAYIRQKYGALYPGLD